MPTRFKTFAVAAALVAGTSSMALAQYTCPPGYAYSAGLCRPVPVPAPAPAPAYPSNPVSGAVTGGQAGAAQGAAAAGPVGAIVGGAVGTATGTVAGTANALTGATAATMCGPGFTYYNGYCYPAR